MPDLNVLSHLNDPNFPENLRIHPSDRYLHSYQHLDFNEFNEASFGSKAQELAIRKYGIAGRVWEAAYMMILYAQPPSYLEFDPPIIDGSKGSESITVIELGSGTGFVASYLLKLLVPGRDRLIVTDLPEVCPLLEENLLGIGIENGMLSGIKDSLIIQPLSWGVHEDAATLALQYFEDGGHELCPLTHIICSDLVYFPELLAPLLHSLLHLTSPPFSSSKDILSGGVGPQVLISYKIRSLEKETAFWSAFGLWFHFSPVIVKDNRVPDDEGQRFGADFKDTAFLFVAKRRAKSLTWTVPLLDSDLLAGVGANGNNLRKDDDTFENILMLTMEQ